MDDEELDLSAQLSAWTVPPAPLNLADRVIARATATDEAIKVVTQRRRTERRWWIGGALAAVTLGAAIAIVIVPRGTTSDGDAATSGIAAATRPEQLALPGAIATLGPGTVVTWQAADGAVHVQHHSGAVTWRIGDRDLVLDVGAVAASIEASNTTLRVETHMNLTDARLITTAAVTSAAVAFATVAVYEGHVKLSSAGQTVVVAPGSTYEVRQGQPPVVELNVAGTPPVERPPAPPPVVALSSLDELVVPLGESITVHNAGAPILIRVDTSCSPDDTPYYPEEGAVGPGDYPYSFTCNGIAKHGRIQVVRDGTIGPVFSPAESSTWGDTVEVAGTEVSDRTKVSVEGVRVSTTPGASWHALVKPPAGLTFIAVRIERDGEINYYIRHAAPSTDKSARHYTVEHITHGLKWGPLPGEAIDATMKTIEKSLLSCIKTRSGAQTLHFDVDPNGTVAHLYATIDDPVSNACVVSVVRHTRFAKASDGTSVSYSLAPPCDADKLIEAGTHAVARGVYAAGLKSYEAALDCKYDDHTIQLTFMAACSAGDVAAARRHWKTLATETQARLVQMCLRNHITREQLDE